MKNSIEVSVICNTYNQVDYISDALEGFVSQLTTFGFVVFVHDDASTDGTREIIETYQRKYPHIIKPIYEKENKYSTGINITMDIMVPLINTKYTALCEGDDFWTDKYKLQKQYNLMETHPDYNMCAHAAISHNVRTGKETPFSPTTENTVLSPQQVIAGGGEYLSTNSLFMRTEMLRNPMPFRRVLQMDYTMQIQGSLPNGILFISDAMSVYRYMAKGSWTERMAKKRNRNKKKEFAEKYVQMLLQLDIDTDSQYHEQIEKLLITHSIIVENSVKDNLQNYSRFKSGMKYISGKDRVRIMVKLFMPYVVRFEHFILRK